MGFCSRPCADTVCSARRLATMHMKIERAAGTAKKIFNVMTMSNGLCLVANGGTSTSKKA